MADWKTLKRHPLSAEYADITGPAFYSFRLKMKNLGFLSGFPIVLHEGMVLDGWQRLRACIETDTEPEFTTLPEGTDPREYVEAVNDARRHEQTVERQERVERAARARAEGKSFRAIAKEEGVTATQIQRDLEDASEEGQVSPPPVTPDGKVTGLDGKTYAASSRPRCDRCRRIFPDPATTTVSGCTACADLRSKPVPKAKKKKAQKPVTDRVYDDSGRLVPMRLIETFNCRELFLGAATALQRASAAMQQAQESTLGKTIRPKAGESFEKFAIPLRRASEWLRRNGKLLVCGCDGEGCSKCSEEGFVVKEKTDA